MAKRQRPPRRSATTTWYERRLREVARVIDALAKKHKNETDPKKAAALIQRSLFSYAGEVENWAIGVSEVMLRRAATDDFREWRKLSVEIGKGLKKEIQSVEVGGAFRELQRQQVKLIKSLPEEAAMKVQEWAAKAVVNGERPETIVKHIVNDIGGVTASRAELIARTETARAQANFQQARAKSIGSTHYVWHTAGDGSVRDRHAALDGTVHAWDDPPVCDVSGGKQIRANPGCSFRCRCWAEPLFEKSKYEED